MRRCNRCLTGSGKRDALVNLVDFFEPVHRAELMDASVVWFFLNVLLTDKNLHTSVVAAICVGTVAVEFATSAASTPPL